jgi:hypothetical protein
MLILRRSQLDGGDLPAMSMRSRTKRTPNLSNGEVLHEGLQTSLEKLDANAQVFGAKNQTSLIGSKFAASFWRIFSFESDQTSGWRYGRAPGKQ